MREVWLANNPRMLQAAALLALVFLLIGGGALLRYWSAESPVGRVAGISLVSGAILGGLLIAAMWRVPRLAFDGRHLLAFVQGTTPIRVPIQIVECFLMGQGPSLLPGEKHAKTETTTLVIKLSDRAEEWSHHAVDHRLAAWCDSYITIRGTWTEPLNLTVVRRLNERLLDAQRKLPQQTAS
jgi:hypothetical protein